MAEHGLGAASSFLQQRTEPSPNSCQKGKVSTKDRGFATLTHYESVFTVTAAIPEGSWFAPGNPPQPLAHGGTPHSTGCGEDSGTLTQFVPIRPLLQVPFLAEKYLSVEWQDSVTLWSKPAHSHTRESALKGSRSMSRAGTSCCRDPPVWGNQARRGGRSLQSQPCLDKSRGVSHVYTTSSDLNQKKKKQGELSRRYTPENSPMRHVQRSTERQGKKEVKKDQSVTETNKIKILFKKN